MTGVNEGILAHARFLAQHLRHCGCSTVVILALYELGVPPGNEGFYFLKRAIVMRCENPGRRLKNDIYSELSLELDGMENNERIDQSIRRAITKAWEDRDEEIWELFFPKTKNGPLKKPSNGDFIAGVASLVEAWQLYCGKMKTGEPAEQDEDQVW